MNTPLVPEQRADKNGVIVTRHVRAGGSPSLKKRLFPSPDAAMSKSSADATAIVDAQLNKLKAFADSNLGFFAKRKMLKTLRPDALATLAKHGVGTYDNTLPMSLMNHCVNTKSCALINDLAAYVDDYGSFKGAFYGDYTPAMYLLGVAKNSMDNDQDPIPYSQADPEERIRQHAVIEAARSLRVDCIGETSGSGKTEHGFPKFWVRKPVLVSYIRNHPHKMEKVVQLVNDRGPEILESGEQAIDELVDNIDAIATPLTGGAL